MIGHIPLIKMRMNRCKPSRVYIHDMVHQLAKDWHDPRSKSGKLIESHDPHISIEPKDDIRTLDMRFLVDLDVWASSNDEKRAKDLFEACKKAGALRVVGCHTSDGPLRDSLDFWMDIYNKGQ